MVSLVIDLYQLIEKYWDVFDEVESFWGMRWNENFMEMNFFVSCFRSSEIIIELVIFLRCFVSFTIYWVNFLYCGSVSCARDLLGPLERYNFVKFYFLALLVKSHSHYIPWSFLTLLNHHNSSRFQCHLYLLM